MYLAELRILKCVEFHHLPLQIFLWIFPLWSLTRMFIFINRITVICTSAFSLSCDNRDSDHDTWEGGGRSQVFIFWFLEVTRTDFPKRGELCCSQGGELCVVSSFQFPITSLSPRLLGSGVRTACCC